MQSNNGQNQGRRSPEDRQWKKHIIKRCNYKCQLCGCCGNLEVHHIKSIKDFPELRHNITNGIAYCHNCHYYGIHNGAPNYKHGKYCKK